MRITIVVFFPVLLSLAVGLWLNSNDWTDLATIQTAWGTASYIVTAGGCKFPNMVRCISRELTSCSNCGIVGCFEQHTWVIHDPNIKA